MRKKLYFILFYLLLFMAFFTLCPSEVQASTSVKTLKASKTRLENSDGEYDFRKIAGMDSSKYAVAQGGCTDGENLYIAFSRNDTGKCIIAKFRMKDYKLVDTSKPLNLDHANDIAYRKNRLYVVHNQGHASRITIINAKTLKVTDTRNINFSIEVPGWKNHFTKCDKTMVDLGACSIAYEENTDCFVVMLKGNHHFLILSSKLKPLRYVCLKKESMNPSADKEGVKYYAQGIDVTDKYIFVGASPQKVGSGNNYILVYDWTGTLKYKYKVGKQYELEHIYHIGNKMYVGFHDGHYETKTATVKKKKGKQTIISKVYIRSTREYRIK